MPRTRNKRVEVRSSDVTVPVSTPASIQAPEYQAAHILGDFSKSILAGIEVREDVKAQEASDEAVVDFALGQSDPKKAERLRAYDVTTSTLRAKSDWITARSEIQEKLGKADVDTMAPEQLQEFLDTEFRGRFGEAHTNKAYGTALAPLILDFQNKTLEDHRAGIIERSAGVAEADLMKVFDDGVRNGAVDYDLLASSSGTIRDGEKRTELYASVLFASAIEHGKPELIENMPDNYPAGPDGKTYPTIKNNPKWSERVMNAKARAEAVKTQNTKAERTATVGAAEMDIARMIISNADISGPLMAYSQMPGADPQNALAMLSASRSQQEHIEGEYSPGAVTSLEGRLRLGQAGFADIFEAMGNGQLGSGQQASQQASRLMGIFQNEKQNRERNEGRPGYNSWTAMKTNLSDRYSRKGPMGLPLNPAVEALRQEAVLEFALATEQAMQNSDTAAIQKTYAEITDRYDKLVDKVGAQPLTISTNVVSNSSALETAIPGLVPVATSIRVHSALSAFSSSRDKRALADVSGADLAALQNDPSYATAEGQAFLKEAVAAKLSQ